jgi:Zn-dependent protease with chaperone function
MIKPLFSRSPASRRERFLEVGKDPLLFALVARVARCIGAPQPRQIAVDCSVNASASFGSWFGVFFGGDLALTIGLPLAAGLNARQLAGILAHELGHLSQSHGMRLGYVVRSINAWFARVVFERDSWDESLVQQSHAGGWAGLIALFARGCVGLVRVILWCWMIVSHALSCFLLRQMERDADSYEIFVAGSKAFESTSRRMLHLQMGEQLAMASVSQSLDSGRLPDDFIALVVALAESLPPKMRRQLDKECLKERTGVLDTHPAMSERIRQAKDAKAPGVFTWERPASILFSNLAKHQRAVSKKLYREMLGRYLERVELVETISALARHD